MELYAATVNSSSRYELDGPGIESQCSEIWCTRPDRHWDPPSLLYNVYCVSFPGVKRPERGVDHPLPSTAEATGRTRLYLYTPSGPLWPVTGWTYPFYHYSDCKLLILLYREQEPLQIHIASKQNNVHGFRFRTSALCVVDCHVSVGLSILHPFIFRPKARTHKWICALDHTGTEEKIQTTFELDGCHRL